MWSWYNLVFRWRLKKHRLFDQRFLLAKIEMFAKFWAKLSSHEKIFRSRGEKGNVDEWHASMDSPIDELPGWSASITPNNDWHNANGRDSFWGRIQPDYGRCCLQDVHVWRQLLLRWVQTVQCRLQQCQADGRKPNRISQLSTAEAAKGFWGTRLSRQISKSEWSQGM